MKKNIVQRLTMPQKELEAYYRTQRAEWLHSGEPIRGIEWRKHTHGLVIALLKVSGFLSGQKLAVIGDKRPMSGGPKIYACTHVGRYDIEMAIRLIREQVWFFMGDPGKTYKNFDGIVLWLNGVIFTDTAYAEDRHIGKETCVKTLEQGGSLLIYPEGAWNITENQVVMPLFPGTAEMAIRTGAEIVPIAIEQYGKHYYANVGEAVSPAGYTLSQKQELTNQLRDTLCTLKWEIWEQFPVTGRACLPEDAAAQFLAEIMSQSENGYTVEEIIRTRFHSKETSPQEAFAHLNQLIPCKENAFLFRGRDKFTGEKRMFFEE